MMVADDTIAAIATPPGIGGVCIVRISGKQAKMIGETLADKPLTPRVAHYVTIHDRNGETIDQGLMLYFNAPYSFTGEDVVEIQGHGGIAVSQALLTTVLDYGARLANPGEFSQRAFLNNKIDLAQAEAVSDLIAARSQSAMKAANRSLQGVFSKKVEVLAEGILKLRMYIEAALDFPEEEIDFLSEGDIENRLRSWGNQLTALIEESTQGKLINNGIDLVLVGKPNAGKSSLLNALSGEERAIVTEQAGTTRDIVREQLIIEGMPVNVLDTAGLRESSDIVEREGIRRSREAITKADLIALLIAGDTIDDTDNATLLDELRNTVPNTPILLLYNKSDLVETSLQNAYSDGVWLSAKTGEGLVAVKQKIAELAGKKDYEPPFIARERHLHALKRAKDYYIQALTQLTGYRAGELVADDLRLCHEALGEITGKVYADDLLGEIFSGFCIGK